MNIINDVHIDVQGAEMSIGGYAIDSPVPAVKLCLDTEHKRKKQNKEKCFFHGFLFLDDFLGNSRTCCHVCHRIYSSGEITDIYSHLLVAHIFGKDHTASHVRDI